MKRTAINSSGQLGSLYDGCRDRIVGQLNVDNQGKLYRMDKTVEGEIKYGDDEQPQNLLQRLPIDRQLRLSILLNLTPNGSIASFIDYPHLTNEYTRLFYYSSVNRIEQLPDEIRDAKQFIHPLMFSTAATHIITCIESGIDLVMILQLPSDEDIVKEIDRVLDKLLRFLVNENVVYALTLDEESLLEKIVHTKAYANAAKLNNLTTVRDICYCIKKNTNNLIDYPISYTLQPIQWLYPQYNREGATFTPLSIELNDKIEKYVLQLAADFKKAETSITEDTARFLGEHWKQRFPGVQKQLLSEKDKFTNKIQRLSDMVVQIRSGQDENLIAKQIFSIGEQMFLQNPKELVEKEQFQYLNDAEHAIDHVDITIRMEHQPTEDDQGEQLQKLRSDSEEEFKNNYMNADCSDGPLSLADIIISSSSGETDATTNNHVSYVPSTVTQISSPPLTEPQISVPPSVDVNASEARSPLLSVSADETINILLLGETGVGKSTFINAFANYLKFNTLQEAQTGEPAVLIPVSFPISVGENFEEYIAKFGDINDSTSEDFQHPGQSVTQFCKSYVFNLQHIDGKKLHIIDTPGFGDTRGLDQDDSNMQHILKYLQNLSHLNAICFLLKPNESRLNIFYRSCLVQLFSLLKSSPCDNIIFCFTNARSTFYTPGDTAPLLKKMLASLPTSSIAYKKDNTFCFDSESFRYLVALQNGITFNELEKQEYEMSWTKSVTESNRLVHYIYEVLTTYRMQSE